MQKHLEKFEKRINLPVEIANSVRVLDSNLQEFAKDEMRREYI